MAGRKEARIFVSIWNDPQFRALGVGAQRLYMFLLSQRDLSYCGVLSLRARRWSAAAQGLTVEEIERDLKALAEPFAEGFAEPSGEGGGRALLVVDEDTEEVFVRSLIRRDEIWKQPNLLRAAMDAATLIESPRILAELLAELHRLPLHQSDSQQVRRVTAEFIAQIQKALPKGSANPLPNPSANPSPDPSQGIGGGNGSSTGDPLTPLPDPPNTSSSAEPEGALPGMPSPPSKPDPGSDDDADWLKFWAVFPKKTGKADARKAWAKAVRKAAPFVIIAGAEKYAAHFAARLAQDKNQAQFIKHPSGWLNGERWNDDLPAGPAGGGRYAPGSGSQLPPRDAAYDPKEAI